MDLECHPSWLALGITSWLALGITSDLLFVINANFGGSRVLAPGKLGSLQIFHLWFVIIAGVWSEFFRGTLVWGLIFWALVIEIARSPSERNRGFLRSSLIFKSLIHFVAGAEFMKLLGRVPLFCRPNLWGLYWAEFHYFGQGRIANFWSKPSGLEEAKFVWCELPNPWRRRKKAESVNCWAKFPSLNFPGVQVHHFVGAEFIILLGPSCQLQA